MTDAIRRVLEQSGITTPLPEPPLYDGDVFEYIRDRLRHALAMQSDRLMLGKRKWKELQNMRRR